MKACIEVNLEPFAVPNFVRNIPKENPRGGPPSEPLCYPLRDLDVDTLDKLCCEFRDEVFRKAGKQKPPINMEPAR